MDIHAVNVLYDFCIMSVLLFVAKIIRAKVRFIQKLYIPTPLMAGFFGLFLGKYFLNILPFSTEIGSYSGILIAVLFATLFLGNKKKSSFKSMITSVGDTFLVNAASEITQFAIFILIGLVLLPLIFKDINVAFGLLLPAGFVGGHGTAAAIGSVCAANGWEDATSIGSTIATVGLLGGILTGVLLINIGVRKKQTAIIKEIHELPEEMQTGLVPEGTRSSMGTTTVNSMSLDSLSWHIALVLISVGGAYLINFYLKKIFPSLSFPVYGIALLCSLLVSGVLRLVKFNDYVDKKVITHIGSSATDYLVGFGVASINIKVVVKYWAPILILCILGFVFVMLWHFIISKRFFRSYWFERSMYIYGMSTGVMATGVILLRVCDPEFESGVLEDFGFAWIFLSIMDMFLVSLSPMFIYLGNGIIYSIILMAISVICLLLCKILNKKQQAIIQ